MEHVLRKHLARVVSGRRLLSLSGLHDGPKMHRAWYSTFIYHLAEFQVGRSTVDDNIRKHVLRNIWLSKI